MAFGFGKKKSNHAQTQAPAAAGQSGGYPEFIPKAGACLATTNVRDGRGRVKFMTREQSQNPADNGWRIFSEFDTQEYMSQGNPFVVMAFNEVCAIEPALIGIYNAPVGSDLAIERDDNGIHIIDVTTGQEIPRDQLRG